MDNLTVDRGKLEMRVVVTFDMLSGVFGLEGCDKNPVVALGMLDYALARVRRFIATNEILQEAQDRSRIAIPLGPM